MTAEYKLQMTPVSDEAAEGRAKELLDGAREKLGFVPNMYRAMAINPGVLSTYLHGYEHFRQSGVFTPPEQEAVFLAVSRDNGCDYCLAAHSMLAVNVSNLPQEEAYAIRAGRVLKDEALNALVQFTDHMWATRGRPTDSEVAAFKQAGYSDIHLLEIILAMAVKTLSNYTNHVNHTEVDDAFAAHRVAAE